MTDTAQTRSQLQTAFADNTAGSITAQSLRNFAVSVPFNTGVWSSSTAYVVNDLVTNAGSSYLCILANTNQSPPNATYWQAIGGSGGGGGGSLLAANNLSDLASASAARTSLGLGTAATQASSAFDAAGTAATAAAAAQAASLPIAGGTMSGSINLGGLDLLNGANLKDAAGIARIQFVNTGSDRALNLNDDTGTAALIITEGNVTLPASSELVLGTGNGMVFDPSSFVFGDGSGNVEFSTNNLTFTATTMTVNPTLSGSTGTISGVDLASSIAVSGSVTAIGTVMEATFQGTTTGKKYIVAFASPSNLSFVDFNGNFIKAQFSAAQAIYVDGTNGSDSRGNGTDISPYLTIAHALSVASSGNCVFVGPGTYGITQIVLPSGVSLLGAGMDVTIINSSAANGFGPAIIVGTGSVVADLTINSANGHNVPPIGFQGIAGSGSVQTSTQFKLRRVRAIGDIDGFYIGNKTGFYSAVSIELRDCIFSSNYDTFQCAAVDATPWPVAVDAINCQFLSTKISGGSTILRCITGAATNLRLFNCLLLVTDTVSTTVGALGVYAGVSISAYGAINFEMYGTTANFSIPNISSSLITTANYTSVGVGGTGSTVKIGGGNAFDPNLMGVSSATVTFLPTPAGKAFAALAVASSAVSPYCGPTGNQFDVAADAAALTSNTLTIANPSATAFIGSAATTDGNETRYRIKNTNASATAMTLAFGTSYNLGGTSVGTIAAGKRAYLTFQFDADNSKWDLTGYINAL